MYYNLASLLLGIFACSIPALTLIRRRKKQNIPATITASFSFCAAAVVAQLFELERRAITGDFSGLADTITASASVSGVLFAFTLMLNLLFLYKQNTENAAESWYITRRQRNRTKKK